MSESAARTHMNHAAEALEGHGASISPAEKVLIYLSMAQAEAAIETADLIRNGIFLNQADALGIAISNLAAKMPGQ